MTSLPTSPADALGEKIVAAGFAASIGILDMNGSLAVPADFPLSAPWDLPSRLFQSPIGVSTPRGDVLRRLCLNHPLLAAHPFVQHVEGVLGVSIPADDTNPCRGFHGAYARQYHHAVDLISAGLWRELIATLDFVANPGSVFQAVCYGLRYSSCDEDRRRSGHLAPVEARALMDAVGASEPADRVAPIGELAAPCPCNADGKRDHWPINGRASSAEDTAWAFIFGIEDGWFEYSRSGFLEWSVHGRERYAGIGATTYVETSGQSAFAF